MQLVMVVDDIKTETINGQEDLGQMQRIKDHDDGKIEMKARSLHAPLNLI